MSVARANLAPGWFCGILGDGWLDYCQPSGWIDRGDESSVEDNAQHGQ